MLLPAPTTSTIDATPVLERPAVDISMERDERFEEREALLRDVRLFHARVREGIDAAVDTLISDIAADVLGRELLSEPANLRNIVSRLVERYFADEPVRVRVSPSDAADLRCALPVVADERLRSGDAVLELRCGSVDATLGARLSDVLRMVSA